MTDDEALWTGIVLGQMMRSEEALNYTVYAEKDENGNCQNWFVLRSDFGTEMKVTVTQTITGVAEARENLLSIAHDLEAESLD